MGQGWQYDISQKLQKQIHVKHHISKPLWGAEYLGLAAWAAVEKYFIIWSGAPGRTTSRASPTGLLVKTQLQIMMSFSMATHDWAVKPICIALLILTFHPLLILASLSPAPSLMFGLTF